MTTAKTDDAKDKAAGKHIPEAPKGDVAESKTTAKTDGDDAPEGSGEPDGSPGSTRNPSDPAADNYAFEPQGVNTDVNRTDVDQGTGVQKPTPVFAGAGEEDGEDEDGATWIDEQVALGRRIAVSTDGDGSSITYEEIVPSNATNTQVAAAKERLRTRLVAA